MRRVTCLQLCMINRALLASKRGLLKLTPPSTYRRLPAQPISRSATCPAAEPAHLHSCPYYYYYYYDYYDYYDYYHYYDLCYCYYYYYYYD